MHAILFKEKIPGYNCLFHPGCGPSFDVILTKQFNFFARFTHERSPDGERTRTTDGRGRTEAGAGCTQAARLSDRKSNISYSAISWGIYIRFRPPSSSDMDGLLCFHPSYPTFLQAASHF